MAFTYTPDHLYEVETKFAAQYGLSDETLKPLKEWRLSTASTLLTDWHRIAVWVVAPVVAGFVQWLATQVRQHPDAGCLSVMRDGWLPSRLLRTMYGIEVKEFWLNRDLAMRAAFGCGDEEALLNWLVRTRLQPLTRNTAMQQLAGLSYSGPDSRKALTIDDAQQLLKDWENQGLLPQIRAEGAKLAVRLMQHWRTVIRSGSKALLVDFACAGNVQRALQTVLTAHHDSTAIEGFNFITTKGAQWARQAGSQLHGFLADDGVPEWFAKAYSRTPELIEIFVAKPSGPLLDYTENGEPKRESTFLNPRQQKLLEDLQQCIIKAAIAFHKTALNFSPHILQCIWGRLLLEPKPAEVLTMADWPLDVGLDGSARRVLAASCERTPEDWTKLQSAWPAGTLLRATMVDKPKSISTRF